MTLTPVPSPTRTPVRPGEGRRHPKTSKMRGRWFPLSREVGVRVGEGGRG
jgi:hypothetical protein